MKNPFEIRKSDRTVQTIFLFFLAAMCLLACASPAAAQKDKKKKNATPDSKSSDTFSALSDEQQIDYTISEMLGAWQLGDIERMQRLIVSAESRRNMQNVKQQTAPNSGSSSSSNIQELPDPETNPRRTE